MDTKIPISRFPGLKKAASSFSSFDVLAFVTDPGYGYDDVKMLLIKFHKKPSKYDNQDGLGLCIYNVGTEEFIEEPADLTEFNEGDLTEYTLYKRYHLKRSSYTPPENENENKITHDMRTVLKFKDFINEKEEVKIIAPTAAPTIVKPNKKSKSPAAPVDKKPNSVVVEEKPKPKGLTLKQKRYLHPNHQAAILKAQGESQSESVHVKRFIDIVNESKKTMTKKELKDRVKDEAKRMFADIKKQGGGMSLSDCKKEAEKTFKEEYTIV